MEADILDSEYFKAITVAFTGREGGKFWSESMKAMGANSLALKKLGPRCWQSQKYAVPTPSPRLQTAFYQKKTYLITLITFREKNVFAREGDKITRYEGI
jgi:hypothetical protein